MQLFNIIFGHRDTPRLVLPAMAPDAFTAQEQHACLKQPCERMDVQPVRAGQPAQGDEQVDALRRLGGL